MKTFGIILAIVGTLIVISAFFMETSIPVSEYSTQSVVNFGLVSKQILLFGFGSLLALIGSMFAAISIATAKIEDRIIRLGSVTRESAEASANELRSAIFASAK